MRRRRSRHRVLCSTTMRHPALRALVRFSAIHANLRQAAAVVVSLRQHRDSIESFAVQYAGQRIAVIGVGIDPVDSGFRRSGCGGFVWRRLVKAWKEANLL